MKFTSTLGIIFGNNVNFNINNNNNNNNIAMSSFKTGYTYGKKSNNFPT